MNFILTTLTTALIFIYSTSLLADEVVNEKVQLEAYEVLQQAIVDITRQHPDQEFSNYRVCLFDKTETVSMALPSWWHMPTMTYYGSIEKDNLTLHQMSFDERPLVEINPSEDFKISDGTYIIIKPSVSFMGLQKTAHYCVYTNYMQLEDFKN